jgi:hypothetical protein
VLQPRQQRSCDVAPCGSAIEPPSAGCRALDTARPLPAMLAACEWHMTALMRLQLLGGRRCTVWVEGAWGTGMTCGGKEDMPVQRQWMASAQTPRACCEACDSSYRTPFDLCPHTTGEHGCNTSWADVHPMLHQGCAYYRVVHVTLSYEHALAYLRACCLSHRTHHQHRSCFANIHLLCGVLFCRRRVHAGASRGGYPPG